MRFALDLATLILFVALSVWFFVQLPIDRERRQLARETQAELLEAARVRVKAEQVRLEAFEAHRDASTNIEERVAAKMWEEGLRRG